MLKYLSLFSGIGSPEQALKNLGIKFELFGFSEIDKYAIKSYCAVHGVDESLNLGDITKIDVESLPLDIDLITHGSPCQDFSVAGNGKGGDLGSGTRSSLMWNTVAICEHCKPKYVIWENVKNVLSKKHRHNFDKYLEEMERIGYNNYYKVLNAKDYGVPQNRERIFVVSIRKDLNKDFEFPKGFDNGIRLKDILEDEVDEKYYINTKKAERLISEYKGNLAVSYNIRSMEFERQGWKDVSPTLLARDYKDPKNVIMPCITPNRLEKRQNGRRFKEDGESMLTLTSQDRHDILVGDYRYDEGLRIRKNNLCPCITRKTGSTSLSNNPFVIYNVKQATMQDGNRQSKIICEQRSDEGLRFFKNNICGTLRTIDSCGDKRVSEVEEKQFKTKVKDTTKKGYTIAGEGDSINLKQPSSSTRRRRVGRRVRKHVGKRIANTLNTSNHQAVVQNYRIRKLTPLECWRLMGFKDEQLRKAEAVCSNSQLYKQAGNSIVVNVMEEIFKNLI